jgi:uncharacterized protein with beta-barrel porin domain
MLPLTGFNLQAPTQMTDDFVGTQLTHLNESPNLAQAQGADQTGMAAGDQPSNLTAWSQAFGTQAHQDPRGTSNGYNLSDAGGTVGIEDALSDSYRMGIAVGDAYSWVRSKDDSGNTGINATEFSLYGGFKPQDNGFYLDYSLLYGYNDYSSSRDVNVGPTDNRVAKANYSGDLYGSTIEAGYGFNISKVVVTPDFSIDYDHLHVAKYSENDANALDLNVEGQEYDRLRLAPGFKIDLPMDSSLGTLTPEFHAKYLDDVISDQEQILASFAGGGTAFSTEGFKPAKEGADVGVSITLATHKNVTISLQYDFEIRADYYSNTGLLNVAYKF